MKATATGISPVELPYHGNTETYTKDSFLVATLYALRQTCKRVLEMEETIEFSFTDGFKQVAQQRSEVTYPRAFLQLTQMNQIRERLNSVAMARGGWSTHFNTSDSEGVKKAHVFPVSIGCDLHYTDNDFLRILRFAERVSMVGFFPALVFVVKLEQDGAVFEFESRVRVDESISFQQVMLDDQQNPGATELIIPMTVESYVGTINERVWVHMIDEKSAIKVETDVPGTSETTGL